MVAIGDRSTLGRVGSENDNERGLEVVVVVLPRWVVRDDRICWGGVVGLHEEATGPGPGPKESVWSLGGCHIGAIPPPLPVPIPLPRRVSVDVRLECVRKTSGSPLIRRLRLLSTRDNRRERSSSNAVSSVNVKSRGTDWLALTPSQHPEDHGCLAHQKR